MLNTLRGDVEMHTDADPADSMFSYLGISLERDRLYSRDNLLEKLRKSGGTDRSLDDIRYIYETRFGSQLILQYPVTDNHKGGGAIVPVQEGFLLLPYSIMMMNRGVQYQLDNAMMLTLKTFQTLRMECKAYMDRLLAAICEMEAVVQGRPSSQYIDAQNNLYYVRAGDGGAYKGFGRCAEPQHGQNQEFGIQGLNYVESFEQAQMELDLYANKHGLFRLEDDDPRKVCIQNVGAILKREWTTKDF